MKVIGITGGIGSGKSTVSEYLTKKGYVIIDADKISREVTAEGSITVYKLAEIFGKEILSGEGILNRKALGAIAFSDESKRKILENIVTTEILRQTKLRIDDLRKSGDYDIIFFDAPTLFESGGDKLVDFVWLVTAEREVRISRVIARDNLSVEDIAKRIDSQMSEEEKAKRSSEIIDNSKDIENLYTQIDKLLKKYA